MPEQLNSDGFIGGASFSEWAAVSGGRDLLEGVQYLECLPGEVTFSEWTDLSECSLEETGNSLARAGLSEGADLLEGFFEEHNLDEDLLVSAGFSELADLPEG